VRCVAECVAMCCSVKILELVKSFPVLVQVVHVRLLRVAVCCSVLQCVAVCCSVWQSMLQCVAVCCSVLQCAACCYFVLQ